MTKLGLLCDRLLEAGWLVALATVPLYFDILSNRVFEPDKIAMLRSIVVLMALAQLVKWLEGLADNNREAGSDSLDRHGLRGNPLAWPALAVAATYLVGTVVSITPWISFFGSYQRLQGTYSMFSYIALFLLVAGNLRRKTQVERILTVALLVSLPVSIYGLVQYLRWDPLPWGGDVATRVTATMGNAIFLAAYLIMVVPITLHRLLAAVHRLRGFGSMADREKFEGAPRVLVLAAILVAAVFVLAVFAKAAPTGANLWWAALPVVGMYVALGVLFSVPRPTFFTLVAEAVGYALLLVLQLLTIFLSGSRGPWIGLMAGLAFFFLLIALRRGMRWLLASTGVVGIAALAFLILFNIPDSPMAPLRSIPYLGRLGELTQTDSGTGKVRTLIWQGTLELLADRPAIGLAPTDPLGVARILVGYGPESMYVAFNKVYPPALAHYEARNASPDRNHNDVLDFVVNVGLLGLAAYLALLFLAFRLVLRRLRAARAVPDQLILVALGSALVAHFVESQTGIAIAATYAYFWLYLAVLSVLPLEHTIASSADETKGQSAILSPAVAGGRRLSYVGTDRRRRDGREVAQVARYTANRAAPITSSVVPLPIVAYCAVVLVAVLILRRTNGVQDPAPWLMAGFAGLVLALIAVALSLGRLTGARLRRASNVPLYVVACLAAAFIIVSNLNVVAADISFKRGYSSDQANQFGASLGYYHDAIRLAGDQDYYYLFLGRAYLELAKRTQLPNAAVPFAPTLERLRALTPAQVGAMSRNDLFNASRVMLEQARDLNPLNTDHFANLGRLYRVWAETDDRGMLDQSADYFRQATTLSPQAAQLYDEWAQVDIMRGEVDEALQKTMKAASVDPAFPWTYLIMGDAYWSQGRMPDALQSHQKVLALDPDMFADSRFEQRIAAYDQAGMLGQLELTYAEAVAKYPNSAGTRSAYGYILARQNKLRDALAQFQAGVRLVPNDWLGYRNIAYVYRGLGMLDESAESAQTASRLAPADQVTGLKNLIGELKR